MPSHVGYAVVDTTGLDDQWRKDFTQGAQQLLKATYVTATDPHYELVLGFGCVQGMQAKHSRAQVRQ